MSQQPLPKSFYDRDTQVVASELLGCQLVITADQQRIAAKVVETEAYLGEDDLACHASHGRTKRNDAMYGPPGSAYIYFVYGMHYCFNVVTLGEGTPHAVLIRAAQPVCGLGQMRTNRRNPRTGKTPSDTDLTNGPAKLCQAMGIDGRFNRSDLGGNTLSIIGGNSVPDSEISTGPRTGIDYAGSWRYEPLRYWLTDNSYVSKQP